MGFGVQGSGCRVRRGGPAEAARSLTFHLPMVARTETSCRVLTALPHGRWCSRYLRDQWVVAFLLHLSAAPTGPGPLAEPPVADGPHWTQTAYFAGQGDQAAVEQVAEAFSITGEQAQKVAVTILVFLVQLAKAAGR